jgi:hypothetical protein
MEKVTEKLKNLNIDPKNIKGKLLRSGRILYNGI